MNPRHVGPITQGSQQVDSPVVYVCVGRIVGQAKMAEDERVLQETEEGKDGLRKEGRVPFIQKEYGQVGG